MPLLDNPVHGEPSVIGLPAAAAVLAMLLAGAAHAGNLSEAVHGDFSSDRLAPTSWLLTGAGTPGQTASNVLSGGLGHEGLDDPDRDYVHVVVPKGQVWSSLVVGPSITVGNSASFLGLAAGSTMPVAPDAIDGTGLLGYRIYKPSDRGKDILPNMRLVGDGTTGFEIPLRAGDYTLWMQELAPGSFQYKFDLVLTAVPEPSTAWLSAAGLALLAWRLRRRPAAG